MRFCFFLFCFLIPVLSFAEVEHTLIRRITVFPIAGNAPGADDAWWKMREELTQNQRFLVASRRFMVNRDVFQARKALKPADVIILAKILDSQALVVTYLDDRQLSMRVYEGENGYTLWAKDISLHPAIPIAEQLTKASINLMKSFIASIPYQGFLVVDPIIGKPVYEEDSVKLAKVFVGSNSYIQPGDTAHWIRVTGDPSQAILGDDSHISVIAEGTVIRIEGDQALISVDRVTHIEDLKESSLVRFPKETARLQQSYAQEGVSIRLGQELISPELKKTSDNSKDKSSTTTSLAFLANLTAFILLAF